jgi:tetratricopeptide (TPR) repeat protein
MGRHYQQGLALFRLRRYREGLNAFTEDLSEEPGNASALAMRAGCLLNLGRIRSADAEIKSALHIDPNLAYAHFVLSLIRAEQFRWRQAETSVREAIRLSPQPAYFQHLGEICFRKSRYAECLGVLDQGLSLDPRDAPSLLLRSRCLNELGRFKEAKECLYLILQKDAENSSAHLALGKLKLQIGNAVDARDHLLEARRLNPVSRHDRSALAATYAYFVWPLRDLERFRNLFDAWSASGRWLLLAAICTFLVSIAVCLQSFPLIVRMVFLASFNLFAALKTVRLVGKTIGKVVFKNDLQIRWYEYLPDIFRLTLAVIVHAFCSALALLCSEVPLVALALGWIPPNVEYYIVLGKQVEFKTVDDSFPYLLRLGCITGPVGAAGVLLNESQSNWLVMACWCISLLFSYLFTVRWR